VDTIKCPELRTPALPRNMPGLKRVVAERGFRGILLVIDTTKHDVAGSAEQLLTFVAARCRA
jgi:hypothetical protein